VIGGDLDEAPPDAPESERGLFHTASLGVSAPREGMMQNVIFRRRVGERFDASPRAKATSRA